MLGFLHRAVCVSFHVKPARPPKHQTPLRAGRGRCLLPCTRVRFVCVLPPAPSLILTLNFGDERRYNLLRRRSLKSAVAESRHLCRRRAAQSPLLVTDRRDGKRTKILEKMHATCLICQRAEVRVGGLLKPLASECGYDRSSDDAVNPKW